MKKKILSVILCTLFAVGILPSAVFAVNTTEAGPQVVSSGGITVCETDQKVDISKTIVQSKNEQGDYLEDEFDITLSVDTDEAIDTIPNGTVYTVLMLDVSISMSSAIENNNPNSELRIDVIKREAKKFIDEYVKNTKNVKSYVSVVLFNTDAVVALDWGDLHDADFYTKVSNIIDGLGNDFYRNLINGRTVVPAMRGEHTYEDNGSVAYDIWYTNTEAAMQLATLQMKKAKTFSQNIGLEKYFAVAVTDGTPTSKGGDFIKSSDTYGLPAICGEITHTWSKRDYPEDTRSSGGDADEQITRGNGKTYPKKDTAWQASVESIKDTAKELEKEGDFYCIFLATSSDNSSDYFGYPGFGGQYAPDWFVENNIAKATMFASNGDSLAEQLKDILDQIYEIRRIAEAWGVTDPMGQNIEFLGGYDEDGKLDANAVSTEDDTSPLYFDTETQTLYWDLKADSVYREKNADGSFHCSFTYHIKLNSAADGFQYETAYPANGDAKLDYVIQVKDGTGVNYGPNKDGLFVIPTVQAFSKVTSSEPESNTNSGNSSDASSNTNNSDNSSSSSDSASITVTGTGTSGSNSGNPSTGDSPMLLFFAVLAGLSAAAVIGIGRKQKRSK